MRRHLMRFLPVFMLALTLQILAPVGACIAAAASASDPLAGAVLCHGDAQDHNSDRSSDAHLRGSSCAACAAVTPFTPPQPQPVIAALERRTDRVTWQAFAPDARAAKIASGGQARAPPRFS